MKILVKIIIFITLSILLIEGLRYSIFCGQVQKSISPHIILQKTLTASYYTDYEGTQIILKWTKKKSEAIISKIYHKRPNFEKIVYIAPPRAKDRIIIDDGETNWHYEPKINKVIRSNSFHNPEKEKLRKKQFELLLKNYKIKFQGKQVIAGRNCYVINIIPKYKGNPSQKVWVDTEYNIILKAQKKSYDGNLSYLSYFQEINFSPKFEKDFFKFKLPKGAKIINYKLTDKNLSIKDIEKKIGFKIILPKFLPHGYELENSTISVFQDKQSAHLRYTDGLNVISLFERKHTKYNSPIDSREINIGKIKGRITTSHEGEILTWTVKNIDLTLIGDIKKSYLLRIAESIGK